MIRQFAAASFAAITLAAFAAPSFANAGTNYDGRWTLSIVTERGACDPAYTFPVNIDKGVVSFPGLVRANGKVTAGGAVKVFVAAGEKSASGSGRLHGGAGAGRWAGRAGNDRCSGSWTVQRN